MNYNKPKMININEYYNENDNSFITIQERKENYKKILDHQLSECFNEKYIIYKSELKDHFDYDDDEGSYLSSVVLNFYFSDVTKENNEQYKTEFTFKYYILIKESIYKKFKNIYSYLNVYSLDYNITYAHNYTSTISELAKFLKPSYNKETITMDGIRYIKIKLRSLTNTLLLGCSFVCDPKYKIWGGNNDVKIMAVPIREKYTNFINMCQLGEPLTENFIADLNSTFTLKTNVAKMYKNILEKYIENIKNGEKIFLDKNKYQIVLLQGILLNNETTHTQRIIFHLYVSFQKLQYIMIDFVANHKDRIDFR